MANESGHWADAEPRIVAREEKSTVTRFMYA
jgi:hypothetical protein